MRDDAERRRRMISSFHIDDTSASIGTVKGHARVIFRVEVYPVDL